MQIRSTHADLPTIGEVAAQVQIAHRAAETAYQNPPDATKAMLTEGAAAALRASELLRELAPSRPGYYLEPASRWAADAAKQLRQASMAPTGPGSAWNEVFYCGRIAYEELEAVRTALYVPAETAIG